MARWKFLGTGIIALTAIVLIFTLAGCPTDVDDTIGGVTGKEKQQSTTNETGGTGRMALEAFSIDTLPEPSYWNGLGDLDILPDIFQWADGTRMSTNTYDWADPSLAKTRRAEIYKIIQHYYLGYMPTFGDAITVQIINQGPTAAGSTGTGTIRVSYTAGGVTRSEDFTVGIRIPDIGPTGRTVSAGDPVPAMVISSTGVPTQAQATAGDWAVLGHPYTSWAAEGNRSGAVQRLFNYNLAENLDAPSAQMMWAWGLGRVIDALEGNTVKIDADALPASTKLFGGLIDPEKLATTGASRGGKAAMMMGIFAESKWGTQVGLTAPASSGAAGFAIERFLSPLEKLDYYLKVDPSDNVLGTVWGYAVKPGEPYDKIYTFGKDAKGLGIDQGFQTLTHARQEQAGWVGPRFQLFAENHTEMNIDKESGHGYASTIPFDTHFVVALCAPRGIITFDGLSYYWTNPEGNYLTYLAAKELYTYLGVPDNIAIRMYDIPHQQPPREYKDIVDFGNILFYPESFPRDPKFYLAPWPIDDPRSAKDYYRLNWTYPGSTTPSIRDQVKTLLGETP